MRDENGDPSPEVDRRRGDRRSSEDRRKQALGPPDGIERRKDERRKGERRTDPRKS